MSGSTGERRPAVLGPSPYPGLRSFSASDEDAARFFGRDRERELVVANLLSSRLTLLYGQSGIGKSSLLCAGIVNDLHHAAAPEEEPAEATAVVYVSDWHGEPEAAVLGEVEQEALRLSGRHLQPPDPGLPFDRKLAWWSERLDAQLLLILDQFEQYFVRHAVGDGRSFDVRLSAAILDPRLPMHCLISLREDALVGLDRFKGEIPNLFRNRLRLDGLSREAALEAIGGPIERYNDSRAGEQAAASLEPGLAEKVVSELQDPPMTMVGRRGPSSTPIDTPTGAAQRLIEPAHLQLVMDALWRRERELGSSSLRRATLGALGGCREIVGSHVEASLDGLPVKQREVAARSIRYLVTQSGIKVAHTPSDLADYAESSVPLVGAMLESLCAQRLMRRLPPEEGKSEARYEVFHDLLAAPMLEWRADFEARRLRARMRWLLAALAAALAAAVGVSAYGTAPEPLRRLELHSIDARFRVRGPLAADPEIAIVDVDDRTLAALHHEIGSELRPYYARLIERVLRGGPKVIVIDLEFLTHGHEHALSQAISRADGRIVLASNTFDPAGEIPLFGVTDEEDNRSLFKQLGDPTPGYTGLPLDADGTVRQLRFMARRGDSAEKGNNLRALSVAVEELIEPRRSLPTEGSTLIDYRGRHAFESVSMIDVLRGTVPATAFKGRVVLIGAKVSGGRDYHRVAFGGNAMPGVELQASAIATVRHGPALRPLGGGAVDLMIAALSLTALLAVLLGSWLALALYVAVGAIYAMLAQLLFDGGVYVPLVYPLLALALSGLATLVARAYLSLQARRQRTRER